MRIEEIRRQTKFRLEVAQRPLARILIRARISPDEVTWTALLLSIVAAMLILFGLFEFAGLLTLLAGGCDLLDGTLARMTAPTRRGAFLDSTLDRVGEGAIFTALVVTYANYGSPWAAGLAALGLLFGQLVSYSRAKAESLDIECEIGLATRGERLLLLVVGLWSGWLVLALVLIAGLSAVTVIQRISTILQTLRNESTKCETANSCD